MVNKYTQQLFGECTQVCLANIFNLKNIITETTKKQREEGTSWLQSRRLIERHTSFTSQNLLFSPTPVKSYLPIFEVDHDFNNGKDLYCVFLLSVKSNIEGYTHCVLAIKENFNPTLNILDPLNKKCKKIHLNKFFKEYDCSAVESICSAEHGGTMFFEACHFKHLQLPQ